MSKKPGNHLQVERVRQQLFEFISRFEMELDAESTPRHIDNVQAVCVLLLEKLVRLQGYETVQTRALEERIDRLAAKGQALWSAAPAAPAVVKAKPRLSLIPGGLS